MRSSWKNSISVPPRTHIQVMRTIFYIKLLWLCTACAATMIHGGAHRPPSGEQSVFERVTFDGEGTYDAVFSGLLSGDIYFDHCTFKNFLGPIAVSLLGEATKASVAHCEFYNNAAQHLLIEGYEHVLVYNNTFQNNSLTGAFSLASTMEKKRKNLFIGPQGYSVEGHSELVEAMNVFV